MISDDIDCKNSGFHNLFSTDERNIRLCVYAGGGAEVNSCSAYALEVILGKSG